MRFKVSVKRFLALLVATSFVFAVAPLVGAAADRDEHEKVVKLTDVPDAVQATIKKEIGAGKITKVLEGSDTEGGKATYYEAKYTLDGKKLEVKVAPDGKLISKGDDDD